MKLRLSLILILPFLYFNLFAQKTKEVKNQLANGDVEEFYVLKDSVDTKQGAYTRKNKYKEIVETGYYKKNEKDGLWKEYNYGDLKESGFYKNGQRDSLWNEFIDDKIVASGYYKNDLKNGFWKGDYESGNYINGVKDGNWKESNGSGSYALGQKIGEWTFYNSKGEKTMIYNLTNKEIIWYDPLVYPKQKRKYKIFFENDSQEVVLDRAPFYFGGEDELMRFLVKHVRYPEMEKEKGIMGTVYVAYEIDTNGVAKNFRIQTSVSPGLDKEALSIWQLTANNYTPAIYKGKRVQVTMIQPLKFVLQ